MYRVHPRVIARPVALAIVLTWRGPSARSWWEGLLGFGLALWPCFRPGPSPRRASGDLNRSFSATADRLGGKVRTGFCGGYASPYSVATDSRGRIVVGGQNTWSDGLCVDRFRANGTRDPSFGSGGEVKTVLGAAGGVRAVAIDSQGRIVAAGFARQSGGDRDFALARYEPNGALDPSFGTGGTVTTDLGSAEVATSVAIDTGGRIVVLGDDGVSWPATGATAASTRRSAPAAA